MAKIQFTQGPTIAGGGADLPTGPEGSILGIVGGVVVATDDADLKAGSLTTSDGISASGIDTDGLLMESDESDGTTSGSPDGFILSDSDTGNAVEVSPNDITKNATSVVFDDDARLSFDAVAMTPGGRLYVPPAYIQPTGDAAVALTSANHKVAIGFVPDVDFPLFALSAYITAVSDTGDITVAIHEDGTAVEPNGLFFSSTTNDLATLSANGSDCSATTEASGKDAFKAFDNAKTADNGWRSTAAPTGVAPQALVRDLGAGNERAFNRARLFTYHNSDANVRCFPRTFTIDADQNDNNWVNLVTVAAEDDPNRTGDGGAACFRQYTWTNTTAYRRYRINITARNGSGDYVSIGEFELFAGMTKSAPGAVLQACGTVAAGSSADVWIRFIFAVLQLYAGRKYWVSFAGQNTKNFSLSKRRVNAANGSMFPDGCECRESTDGGTTWTESQQDLMPAMLNVVLNSTTHHVPQLVYGRRNGTHISLYDGSSWTALAIPAAGIALDMEAHSAPNAVTGYRVFVYNNAGTLTLTAEDVALAAQDGIPVKTGATGRRFVGLVYPLERQTGYYGPISCPDELLVWNLHNRKRVTAGKACPYVASTYRYPTGPQVWEKWYSDDFRVRVLCGDTSIVSLSLGPFYKGSNSVQFAVAINDTIPVPGQMFPEQTSNTYIWTARSSLLLAPGLNTLNPCLKNRDSLYQVYFFVADFQTQDRNARFAAQCLGHTEV